MGHLDEHKLLSEKRFKYPSPERISASPASSQLPSEIGVHSKPRKCLQLKVIRILSQEFVILVSSRDLSSLHTFLINESHVICLVTESDSAYGSQRVPFHFSEPLRMTKRTFFSLFLTHMA